MRSNPACHLLVSRTEQKLKEGLSEHAFLFNQASLLPEREVSLEGEELVSPYPEPGVLAFHRLSASVPVLPPSFRHTAARMVLGHRNQIMAHPT